MNDPTSRKRQRLEIGAVCDRYNRSPVTIWSWYTKGTFPKPHYIGNQRHWWDDELDDWDRSILAEAVPNPGDIVFVANDYYRRPAEVSVPVIQLTYPDDEGRFPWDPGCTSNQPRPGEFSAWSR